jgi:DNA-binding transcriptional ArsR family regulator
MPVDDRGEREIRLDRAFHALGDAVRRAMIARLSRGPATVNELAEPFGITVQAVSRHIRVLEEAGLVTRTRQAQRRPVHLNPGMLEELTAWIDGYRLAHERRFRALDAVLAGMQDPPRDAHGPDSNPRDMDLPSGRARRRTTGHNEKTTEKRGERS